ncbi:ATP-binding cassette domain-containing protein [Alkalibaculum sp. M08DMB]|uniref:ATP-binding cassette domain-containing protein n=1 Tax=Alkalibaculum sporogenes TaxID=2655001 RepID=A0A6A7K6F4_9FIRM|nr:oligopeptide/dipeptide ABC transporter ATP-binding protein [Alkalibaculum sporogenes]MPW24921.1 ATP-binding cassette domain-containing protein [Alkalibaculum sporogenes]
MDNKLIEIKNLKKYFPVREGIFATNYIKAVDDVSLYINKGETFGLVGESGCGKTTLGRTLLKLCQPTDGQIFYKGEDITFQPMGQYRKKMQIVFQNPYASLNPRMTVYDIIGEPIDIHRLATSKRQRKEMIISLLSQVGLNYESAMAYPHEFSGGQRQRIVIARALAVEPDFIVCDEPVSSLDVSIQAQIINMFERIQEERGITYLFISHDLSIVSHISDRVGVMYLGKIVELTDSKSLYSSPIHPYTQSLLSAIIKVDSKDNKGNKRLLLKGDIPSPLNPPSGCRFRTRCVYEKDICIDQVPELQECRKEHFVACHRVGEF